MSGWLKWHRKEKEYIPKMLSLWKSIHLHQLNPEWKSVKNEWTLMVLNIGLPCISSETEHSLQTYQQLDKSSLGRLSRWTPIESCSFGRDRNLNRSWMCWKFLMLQSVCTNCIPCTDSEQRVPQWSPLNSSQYFAGTAFEFWRVLNSAGVFAF